MSFFFFSCCCRRSGPQGARSRRPKTRRSPRRYGPLLSLPAARRRLAALSDRRRPLLARATPVGGCRSVLAARRTRCAVGSGQVCADPAPLPGAAEHPAHWCRSSGGGGAAAPLTCSQGVLAGDGRLCGRLFKGAMYIWAMIGRCRWYLCCDRQMLLMSVL